MTKNPTPPASKQTQPLPKNPSSNSKSSKKRRRQKEKETQKQKTLVSALDNAKQKYLVLEQQTLRRLKQDASQKMLWQALEKGTVNDKLRALSVFVQENPWTSLDFMRRLALLARDKNSKTRLLVHRETKELFKGPLREIIEQSRPFVELHSDSTTELTPEKQYVLSVMRQHLKKLLDSVSQNLKENLTFFKLEYIEILAELGRALDTKCVACYRPLVDKVGDSEPRIGTTAAKYVTLGIMFQAQAALGIVQQVHLKLMNSAAGDALPFLVCLANVDYGKVQDKLVLYKALEIFLHASQKSLDSLQSLKKTRQDALERSTTIIRQVTRGINRLLPHIKNFRAVGDFFGKYMDGFFKMAHVLPSRARVQVLIFIFQIAKSDMYSDLAARFMTLLYASLESGTLLACSLSEQYFDLLFSALTEDFHEGRVLGFLKRLFCVGVHCSSRVILAVLVFFAKLLKEKPVLKNLLGFKKEKRVASGKILQNKKVKQWGNEEGDEVEVVSTGTNKIQEETTTKDQIEEPTEKEITKSEHYDPSKRNPKFCNGDKTALWELLYLSEHYNYLVRKFARMILSGKAEDIDYKGNPMIDFSTGSIINRLVSRSIKKVLWEYTLKDIQASLY